MSNQNSAFKALSDPSRRKILQLLKEKDLTAGEIADCFNISKPSISHHLNLLKQANLVINERKGAEYLLFAEYDGISGSIGFFSEFH